MHYNIQLVSEVQYHLGLGIQKLLRANNVDFPFKYAFAKSLTD